MEKHIEIFCKQNPNTELECPKCHVKISVKTSDFLKKKYTYECKCNNCGSTTSFVTKNLHKELEKFKKYV